MNQARKGVLFVDDDEDLREVMREALGMLAVPHVVVGSVQELRVQRTEVLGCTLAILDINLGPGKETGIDAARWLRAEGFDGGVVFLTGHGASDARVTAARDLAGTNLLSKPISFKELERLVTSSITTPTPTPVPVP